MDSIWPGTGSGHLPISVGHFSIDLFAVCWERGREGLVGEVRECFFVARAGCGDGADGDREADEGGAGGD